MENFTFCDGRENRSMCKKNIKGEFLEIGIKVQNGKGNKGKEETEENKNKRQGPFKPGGDKKQPRIRCFKQRGKNGCPRILVFGDDEVGVASQVKFICGILVLWVCGWWLAEKSRHTFSVNQK